MSNPSKKKRTMPKDEVIPGNEFRITNQRSESVYIILLERALLVKLTVYRKSRRPLTHTVIFLGSNFRDRDQKGGQICTFQKKRMGNRVKKMYAVTSIFLFGYIKKIKK